MERDRRAALVQAQMADAVRIVLFTGTGRAFCAGDDIKGYLAAETEDAALVPPLPAGHTTPLGTYDGLRTVSQQSIWRCSSSGGSSSTRSGCSSASSASAR